MVVVVAHFLLWGGGWGWGVVHMRLRFSSLRLGPAKLKVQALCLKPRPGSYPGSREILFSSLSVAATLAPAQVLKWSPEISPEMCSGHFHGENSPFREKDKMYLCSPQRRPQKKRVGARGQKRTTGKRSGHGDQDDPKRYGTCSFHPGRDRGEEGLQSDLPSRSRDGGEVLEGRRLVRAQGEEGEHVGLGGRGP